MKDTEYYDRISRSYSSTRYPERTQTFVQYFFKERLAIVLDLVRETVSGRTGLSLLEIGCADGVVARAIYEAFPDTFDTIDAVDISPGMIAVARELHKDTPIRFEERSKLVPRTYDIVLEVGVLNYTSFAEDMQAIAGMLGQDGRGIISIAGSDSLKNRFAPDKGYLHLETYATYERMMRAHFHISKAVPVALMVPLLWRIPPLGRAIQPMLEHAFRNRRGLYHEQVFLLARM